MSDTDKLDSIDDLTPARTGAAHLRGVRPFDAELRAPNAAAADEVHLADYANALYKRRWIAATLFLLVFISAVVSTFMTSPIFDARTRMLIEIADPNVVAFKEVIEEGQPNPDYYQTQYCILRCRALARRTIDSLGLWNSPLLVGAPVQPAFDIKALLGFRQDPVQSEGPAE